MPSICWRWMVTICVTCRSRCARPICPRLLARRPDGIFLSEFEQGEIGPDLFRAACNMGLEGLVSKRRDRPYQGGRSKHWVKVKNRKHPSMSRVMER
jgi:bifunctional non-homologous end joining protein LigD